MSGEIVPFGKYKGKPVEALAQDRQYVDWVTAQPWFREKFANIYTLIVNNFQEPSETPDHNRLQVLFLKPEFQLAVVQFAFPEAWLHFQAACAKWEGWIAAYHALAVANPKRWRDGLPAEMKGRISDFDAEEILGGVPNALSHHVVFEQDGFDVYFRISVAYRTELGDYSVEIKPTIGDEFPAVLRQIKAAYARRFQPGRPTVGNPILFLEEYVGQGATLEQFIAVFEADGIRVVFLDEVT